MKGKSEVYFPSRRAMRGAWVAIAHLLPFIARSVRASYPRAEAMDTSFLTGEASCCSFQLAFPMHF